jgi:hypothetical protein
MHAVVLIAVLVAAGLPNADGGGAFGRKHGRLDPLLDEADNWMQVQTDAAEKSWST